jgi:hypothetical protein
MRPSMPTSLLLALACACNPYRGGESTDTDATAVDSDDSNGDSIDTADTGSSDGDSDGDGVPDATDDCPDDPSDSVDSDGDGVCDSSDGCVDDGSQWSDADGDGWCDEIDDDCPDNPAGHDDANGDNLCDGRDDSDNDGIANGEEEVYGFDCGKSDPYKADSDDDGVADPDDPYPLDPWAEYILWRNESGTIDMALSNRDGTFQPVVTIGKPYGDTGNTSYRYTSFVIADFDGNGATDFLALADPGVGGTEADVWFFWRKGSASTFDQRKIGTTTVNFLGAAADLNNDERMDLVQISRTPTGGYVATAALTSFIAAGSPIGANCVTTTDPTNPDGCLFIEKPAADVSSWMSGAWSFGMSRDLVDVDGDGNRDIALSKIASGGDDAVPIAIAFGNGDGTFDAPVDRLVHNNGACGGSPANTLMFADFNNDEIGDLIAGLDDDGDAGSAWFYPGKVVSGTYTIETASCREAFDTNPTAEYYSEQPGVGWARNFDFDFDGTQDVMVGNFTSAAWSGPSRTELRLGNGDGTFGTVAIVRDFSTGSGHNFALPQQVCPRFPR